MKKISIYICEYCDKVFYNKKDCVSHEDKCFPCNSCENAYYSYGMILTCDYQKTHKCSNCPTSNVYKQGYTRKA